MKEGNVTMFHYIKATPPSTGSIYNLSLRNTATLLSQQWVSLITATHTHTHANTGRTISELVSNGKRYLGSIDQLKNWPTCSPTHTGQFSRGAHTPLPLSHTHTNINLKACSVVQLSAVSSVVTLRLPLFLPSSAKCIRSSKTWLQHITDIESIPNDLSLFQLQQHWLDKWCKNICVERLGLL